ncbi:MAG: hypothetical protein ABIU96_02445 [Rhodanobacter sp.]
MTTAQTRRSPAVTGLRDRTTNTTYAHAKPIDRLLPLLQHVHPYGTGFRSDCPNGHDHARGSLAITEGDDGAVLLHCFACNDTRGILGALGLELADLFPESIRDSSPEARKSAQEAFKRNGWGAALGVLEREATVVEIAAHDLADGKPLDNADHERLLLACERIHGAREVLA